MPTLRLAASFAFCALAAFGQSIPVNFPSLHGYRHILVSLDGFNEHLFPVTDHGVAVEMKGILLGQFLWTAGWGHAAPPDGDRSRYWVRVEGSAGAALFTLPEVEPGSLNKRALLIRERSGKRVPWEEAPLLVVVNGDGVVTETIKGVLSIRVTE
jgi:hypothetical protein